LSALVELGIGDVAVSQSAGGNIGALNQTGWIAGSGGLTPIYLRHAYGTYKFSAGTLLVGQTWTPYTVVSEQRLNDDQSNCYFGALYDARLPQVKFTSNMGLYVDLIRPATALETSVPAGSVFGSGTAANPVLTPTYKANLYFPKVAIGYDGKAGDTTFGIGVLGQTYKSTAGIQTNSEMLYLHAKTQAGPFDALANFSIGNNIKSMGFNDGAAFAPAANASENGYKSNVTTWTGLVGVGYKLSDLVKVNAGIGGGSSSGTNGTIAKPTLAYDAYLSAPITIVKNFYVTPEIDYIDSLKSAYAENGYTGFRNWVYGAQFRVDF